MNSAKGPEITKLYMEDIARGQKARAQKDADKERSKSDPGPYICSYNRRFRGGSQRLPSKIGDFCYVHKTCCYNLLHL